SCGTCTLPQTCQPTGVCACVPDDNATICARAGHNCGSLTSNDCCGNIVMVASCGTCTTPQTCQPTGVCACVPESDPTFCARLGKNCGSVTAADNCAAMRTVGSCGICTLPATCGASNVCSCTPESNPAFCARLGKNCGPVSGTDNCGATRTAVAC